MLWINSKNAIVTEVNHNQMNKGNKIKTLNELHQTNLKEIPLDLLSALPETQEVAMIVSKTKKKFNPPFGRDVSLLIFIFNFYFYKYSQSGNVLQESLDSVFDESRKKNTLNISDGVSQNCTDFCHVHLHEDEEYITLDIASFRSQLFLELKGQQKRQNQAKM